MEESASVTPATAAEADASVPPPRLDDSITVDAAVDDPDAVLDDSITVDAAVDDPSGTNSATAAGTNSATAAEQPTTTVGESTAVDAVDGAAGIGDDLQEGEGQAQEAGVGAASEQQDPAPPPAEDADVDYHEDLQDPGGQAPPSPARKAGPPPSGPPPPLPRRNLRLFRDLEWEHQVHDLLDREASDSPRQEDKRERKLSQYLGLLASEPPDLAVVVLDAAEPNERGFGLQGEQGAAFGGVDGLDTGWRNGGGAGGPGAFYDSESRVDAAANDSGYSPTAMRAGGIETNDVGLYFVHHDIFTRARRHAHLGEDDHLLYSPTATKEDLLAVARSSSDSGAAEEGAAESELVDLFELRHDRQENVLLDREDILEKQRTVFGTLLCDMEVEPGKRRVVLRLSRSTKESPFVFRTTAMPS